MGLTRKNYLILLLIFWIGNGLGLGTGGELFAQYWKPKSKPSARISFTIKCTSPKPTTNIYVAGNLESLGPWNPARIILINLGDGTWLGTASMPIGAVVDLKYTRGSWDKEEVDQRGQTIIHSFTVQKDTLITHTIRHWKDEFPNLSGTTTFEPSTPTPTDKTRPKPPPPPPPPFQFIRNISDFKGGQASTRNLTIYLPPAYETDKSRRFPTLYVHDGQQRFHASDSFNGKDWKVGSLVKKMIQRGEMEEVIVVVIHNQNDYSLNSFSYSMYNTYISFVTKGLKPFIDKNYRTLKDPANTASMGSDISGLIAFILAWEHPEQFGKAICFSPIFEFGRQYFTYAKTVRATSDYRMIDIYIDNGSSPKERRMQVGIDRMLNLLIGKGYNPTFLQDVNNYWQDASTEERLRRAIKAMF